MHVQRKGLSQIDNHLPLPALLHLYLWRGVGILRSVRRSLFPLAVQPCPCCRSPPLGGWRIGPCSPRSLHWGGSPGPLWTAWRWRYPRGLRHLSRPSLRPSTVWKMRSDWVLLSDEVGSNRVEYFRDSFSVDCLKYICENLRRLGLKGKMEWLGGSWVESEECWTWDLRFPRIEAEQFKAALLCNETNLRFWRKFEHCKRAVSGFWSKKLKRFCHH